MSAPKKNSRVLRKSKRRSTFDDLPYHVEYSKSGRSKCNFCLELIPKDNLRLAVVVQNFYHDSKKPLWYHADCFFKKQQPKTTGAIAHFDSIRWEDQEYIRKEIGEENIPPQAKKSKLVSEDDTMEEDWKAQQMELFEIRDKLEVLKKKDRMKMLKANKQHVPISSSEILDTLADALLFGALKPCLKCGGQLVLSNTGYKCTRIVSKWDVQCENITQNPKRKEFLIPEYLKTMNDFLESFEPKIQRRLLRITAPSTSSGVNQKDMADDPLNVTGNGSASTTRSASKGSIYDMSVSGKVKLRVKGGGAVDPDSGLEDIAHVYQRGKEKFTATLGYTDTQKKKNSFYKLQILKEDKENKYWLFRSWGRTGTTIGSNKCESMALEDCIQKFEDLFEEKSGNPWRNSDHFVKVPRKMYPIDIDHGADDSGIDLLNSSIESKLDKPVQDLMRLIFDVELMKKAMLEYEIDMDKMPLGNISKKQIQQAYSVLSDLLALAKNGSENRTKFIEASNEFYTLIPHNFGIDGSNIIDTERKIQSKLEMLESLFEMKIAYSLLNDEMDESKNPLDAHYEQLKTKIDVLDRESDEFQLIEKYVKNTHGETHDFELVVEEVFIVRRNGEESRYEPFKELPNRKLLWHGSRITNYAGILSQGLRIAPPEAPVTGYMFGKGVYFADMVTKSAQYSAGSENSTGLLLLCNVALGNMYEKFKAEYIEKLPDAYHSTWARGRTQPDPEQSVKLETGVEVPCGPPIRVQVKRKCKLRYNEYIVYDVAQVKIEYLVKIKYKSKQSTTTNIFAGVPASQGSMFGGTQFSQPTSIAAGTIANKPPIANIFGGGSTSGTSQSSTDGSLFGGQANSTTITSPLSDLSNNPSPKYSAQVIPQ